MIKIDLNFNYGSSWYSEEGIHVKGEAFNQEGTLLKGKALAACFKDFSSWQDFTERLNQLNGLFAIIIQRGEEVFAAVDKIRSIPLLYSYGNRDLFLSDCIDQFPEQEGRSSREDKEAVRFARSFGYTPNNRTLLANIKQLRSGECLHYTGSAPITRSYITHPTTRSNEESREELEEQFLDILDRVGQRLLTQIGDRPVALPLSGGFDSRLIGLMLKKGGKKNVTCFTFGNRDHREAIISQQIAQNLSYPWLFIDYRDYIGEEYTQSPQFKEYTRFFCNGISFPFLQEYFAGRYFRENNILPPDTIFLPGHSGDMAGGSHLFPDMKHFQTEKEMWKTIYNRDGGYIPLSRSKRERLIEQQCFSLDGESLPQTFQDHDRWNRLERQAKHIVNSSKAWNFFGYEYLLPLWDDELVDFLFSLPFELRLYKNFYDSVLVKLFQQNSLFLKEETIPSREGHNKAFRKRKLREVFPLINLIKPKKHFVHDFFYHQELLEPIRKQMGDYRYHTGIGLLTGWYIRDFFFKE